MRELSISISGGAAHGAVAAGALTALRKRGVVPATASGISSGIMAAALAYGSLDREAHLAFFRHAFELVRGRRRPATLLPPFDTSGEDTLRQLAEHVLPPDAIRKTGLRSLWAGVASFPLMRFERHDLLAGTTEEAVLQIARSSMMPFMTHDTLHLQRGMDGGFRYNHFIPPDARGPRWLMTYARKPLTSGRGPRRPYDRVILLNSPFRFALHLDSDRLERAWDHGFEQGMRISLG